MYYASVCIIVQFEPINCWPYAWYFPFSFPSAKQGQAQVQLWQLLLTYVATKSGRQNCRLLIVIISVFLVKKSKDNWPGQHSWVLAGLSSVNNVLTIQVQSTRFKWNGNFGERLSNSQREIERGGRDREKESGLEQFLTALSRTPIKLLFFYWTIN